MLPAVLILVWAGVAATGAVNPHLLVPPLTALTTLAHTVAGADYWLTVGSSVARLAAGFALGATAGVAVGVIVGRQRAFDRVVAPTLNATRQVALFAWIPFLTAWFGDGEVAKIGLIAAATFFPVALNTENGCRHVPAALLEVGRVLEFDRRAVLRNIVLPAASPSIVTGLQVGLTTAWIGTIGAEYLIDQGRGIGVALAGARIDNRMDLVLVYMLTLAVAGLLISRVVRRGITVDA